jgi:hypothetical protein
VKRKLTLKHIFTRLFFSGTLFGLLFLVACASEQLAPTTHQTYIFYGPASYSAQPHSGDLIQLDWKPQATELSTAPAPDAILLTAKLIGPFTSPADLQASVAESKKNHDTFAKNRIAAAADDILTDTWNNSPHSSLLTIPGKLPPGYYDLFYASILTSKGKILTTRTDSPLHIQ